MRSHLIKAIALLAYLPSANASETTSPTYVSALKASIQYPPEATALHHEGVVMMLAHVDATGHVSESRIDKTSGLPELDQAALSSVSAWLFKLAKGRAMEGA